MKSSYEITVSVKALVARKDMDTEDRECLGSIVGDHVYDLDARELPDFLSRFENDEDLDPDYRELVGEEKAHCIIQEWALDAYHDDTAIAMLEDFEIDVDVPEEATAAMLKVMSRKPADEHDGPGM